MSIDFYGSSYRAGQSDLQVSVSPLGLIELSDTEWEVNGPRLSRYAVAWGFYLGHHFAVRPEAGESQLTFNYVRALSDWIVNFCFGKGVTFRSPKETEAIIPELLQRVWEVDNDKPKLLWEMGQVGSVSGDVFLKVAYEDAYLSGTDEEGNAIPGVMQTFHPGKCRILPINPSYAFPEWHPHDRSRIIRFKLRYRSFAVDLGGTMSVFTYSEILTEATIEEYVNDELIDSRPNILGEIPIIHIPNIAVSGSPWGLSDIAEITSLNREFNEKATEVSEIIAYHACVDVETEALTREGWKKYGELRQGEQVLTLDPDTDEIHWQPLEAINVFKHTGPLVRWDNRVDALTTPNHRWLAERRIGRPQNKRFERQIVRTALSEGGELAASELREGSLIVLGGGTPAHFPTWKKYDDEFIETIGWWVTEGCYVYPPTCIRPTGTLSQSVTQNEDFVKQIRRLAVYWKSLGAFFTERPSLTRSGCATWYLGVDVIEALDEAAPGKSLPPEFLTALTHQQASLLLRILVDGDGNRGKERLKSNGGRVMWFQDDLGRRDGYQMLSAMLSGARTRSFENNRGDGVVDTYQTNTIEILSTVKKAVEVPNEAGVVWCPTVSTGIWFARRHGNTYWTGNSPVTVITGAKSSNLEKGAKKVWALPNKDSQVFNLTMGEDLNASLGFLDFLKRSMHELTSVPEGALGQQQPISNTSGVALSIQYQPAILRREMKKVQYTAGLQRTNYLVLRTLAVKEPEAFSWNPSTDAEELQPGQLAVLDLEDPVTYRSIVHWPDPLPIDQLIKLNEIMARMNLGLESKTGALRELGYEFPDQKMAEIFGELMDDAKRQGALDMVHAQITQAVALATGIIPDGGGEPVVSAGGGSVTSAGAPTQTTGQGGSASTAQGPSLPPVSPAVRGLLSDLNIRAWGTRSIQVRNPANDPTEQ